MTELATGDELIAYAEQYSVDAVVPTRLSGVCFNWEPTTPRRVSGIESGYRLSVTRAKADQLAGT